jgi:hypothetical protein
MDFTGTYIVMCAVPELQEELSGGLMLGDYVGVTEKDSPYKEGYVIGRLGKVTCNEEGMLEGYELVEEIVTDITLMKEIKYPLVKLLEEMDLSFHRMLVEFNYFYMTRISNEGLGDIFDSMEKCWLCFLMYSMYSMSWSGKKWVKERVESGRKKLKKRVSVLV